MTIGERKAHIIQRVNTIRDEHMLEILDETLNYFIENNVSDITDELSAGQLQELTRLAGEPADKNTIGEDEFKNLLTQWRMK